MEYLDYHNEKVYTLCHHIKNGTDKQQKEAIKIMAEYMSKHEELGPWAVLIPAPNHRGRAEYTKLLAEEISRLTGAKVADMLRCSPHKPLYELRKEGEFDKFAMFYDEKAGEGVATARNRFFVDNVMSRGTTYNAARDLLGPDLIPLVYAVDYTQLNPITEKLMSKEN